MQVTREEKLLVVKLEPGEEVMASLASLVAAHDLPGASLSGIGALSRAKVGYLQPEKKRYDMRDFDENLELLSLVGSLAHGPEGPVVHAHVTLGRADYSLVGGHLFEATVSATLEVFVSPTATKLERRLDPRFNLKLLELCQAPPG